MYSAIRRRRYWPTISPHAYPHFPCRSPLVRTILQKRGSQAISPAGLALRRLRRERSRPPLRSLPRNVKSRTSTSTDKTRGAEWWKLVDAYYPCHKSAMAPMNDRCHSRVRTYKSIHLALCPGQKRGRSSPASPQPGTGPQYPDSAVLSFHELSFAWRKAHAV